MTLDLSNLKVGDEVLADLRKWRAGEAPITTSDFVESLITHLQAANV